MTFPDGTLTGGRIDRVLDTWRNPRYGIVVATAMVGVLMTIQWTPAAMVALPLALATLLVPRTMARAPVWFVAALFWITVGVLVRHRMEDHAYLYIAWVVALAISLLDTDDFLEVAARHARLLIGLTFGAAVAWKVYFGQFITGTALWVFSLTDGSFRPLALLMGFDPGVTNARPEVTQLVTGTIDSMTLDAPSGVAGRIVAVSVGVMLLEACIALAHLAPNRSRLAKMRLPALALFGVLAFGLVPSLPFAAVLALLMAVVARWRTAAFWTSVVMVTVAMGRFLQTSSMSSPGG